MTTIDLPEPKDDGLLIPEVGEWSQQKHYFLMRYIDAFTTAMKDKWGGLHYIDLFAGAGIEKLKTSGKLDWGSPLIAAQTRFKFDGLHLCEKKPSKFAALKERVAKFKTKHWLYNGDANQNVIQVLKEIPQDTLSLVFLDPYGLHLDFNTIKVLADRRADLIIFFPDHLDALRNWERYYLNNPRSNLDSCLGKGVDWRALLNANSQKKWAEVLKNLYVQQLRSLGYKDFEYQRILNVNHPLYLLIFCSRHEMGAKLWRKISVKSHDGQRSFGFE